MGLFSRVGAGLRRMVGGVDAEAARIGRPAQAELLQVVLQRTTVRIEEGVLERVCDCVVRITMAGMAPYQARVRQRIPELYLGWLEPGDPAMVAAKVHPRDPLRIALDFDTLLPRGPRPAAAARRG